MYGADGSKQPGFASSKVPTLEEKMLSEQKPDQTEKENETPLQDQIKHGKAEGEPQQAKVTDGSGELYGAPADASTSPQTDDRPPNSRPGHEDANDEEKAAVGARSNLRKHLSAKLGTKGWTVPTPAPEINPHGFDDPLDESFFKGVWTAAAVHNVSCYYISAPYARLTLLTRRKYTGRFSIVLQTILLQPGNSTRSFLFIKTDSVNQWVAI